MADRVERRTTCERCGKKIEQKRVGEPRRFCSPLCQKRSWAEANPGKVYRQSRNAWLFGDQEAGRRRARARTRALSALAKRHPEEYQQLLKEAIANDAD